MQETAHEHLVPEGGLMTKLLWETRGIGIWSGTVSDTGKSLEKFLIDMAQLQIVPSALHGRTELDPQGTIPSLAAADLSRH